MCFSLLCLSWSTRSYMRRARPRSTWTLNPLKSALPRKPTRTSAMWVSLPVLLISSYPFTSEHHVWMNVLVNEVGLLGPGVIPDVFHPSKMFFLEADTSLTVLFLYDLSPSSWTTGRSTRPPKTSGSGLSTDLTLSTLPKPISSRVMWVMHYRHLFVCLDVF